MIVTMDADAVRVRTRTSARRNVDDHGVRFHRHRCTVFDGRPTFTYRSPRNDEDRWGTVAHREGQSSIWWYGPRVERGGGSSPPTGLMTGKSENIVRYTAEEVDAMRRRGEGRTDWDMSQEEAMRRRRADPEAPLALRRLEGHDHGRAAGSPRRRNTLRLDRRRAALVSTRRRSSRASAHGASLSSNRPAHDLARVVVATAPHLRVDERLETLSQA